MTVAKIVLKSFCKAAKKVVIDIIWMQEDPIIIIYPSLPPFKVEAYIARISLLSVVTPYFLSSYISLYPRNPLSYRVTRFGCRKSELKVIFWLKMGVFSLKIGWVLIKIGFFS